MNAIIDNQIETGLQILDKYEADLIALRESMKGLKIAGPEDREGYRLVRENRITLKNTRVKIEKAGKELREPAIRFQKAVIKKEDDLIAIIAPLERQLQAQEEQFDRWQEEARIEKERAEKAKVQARVTALAKFNAAHDLYDLQIMDDAKFLELLTQVEADYNAEQERIAAEKAEAERQRIAEQERLRVEREALELQRKAQEAQEEQLRAEREALRKEQELREAELKAEREKIEAEKRELEKQKVIKEAEERARKEEAARIEREAQEKAERESLAKLEAERQEALRPDKEKLISFFDSVHKAAESPSTLKDASTKKLAADFVDRITYIVEQFKAQVKDL